MKKGIIPGIIPFGMALILSACGTSEPPVKVQTFDKVNPLWGIKYVEVKLTSIEDEVEVKDVIVNRGNCKIENKDFLTGTAILPKTLKFGQSVSVSFSAPCEASQVDVVTNQGDWKLSY